MAHSSRKMRFWAVAVAVAIAAVAGARVAAADSPSDTEVFGAAPGGAGGAGGAPAAAGGGGESAPGRPSEDEMFGGAPGGAGGAAPPPAVPPAARPAAGSSEARDEAMLGDPNAGPKLSQETAPEDPLKIGGQIYLRMQYRRPSSPTYANVAPAGMPIMLGKISETNLSAPSLVDGYFDARPNDRVRGFVLGRLFFDPTLPTTATMPSTGLTPTNATGDMTGTGQTNNGQTLNTAVPLVSGVGSTRGPSVVLDQLWLRFDILHTVFVTAGRQHVKWGTGRVWTPTDYLHPERRNPVAVFDARPGFNMLKLHFPWEERGWNFYAFGLVEGVHRIVPSSVTNSFTISNDTTPTLGDVGSAARAELVLGTAELGLDAVYYRGQKPRWGADLSFGIGDFDLYADAGFRYGSELPRVRADATFLTPPGGPEAIEYNLGVKPQVVAGGTWSMKYNDNDVFTVGGEYFYNARGYSDPSFYPALFRNGLFEFFYTGRHYAAVTAVLAAPWSWNYTTFSFSTLGNLSDQSFISRLDYSLIMLTHLRFEAFGAVNYGRREGEFRLGTTLSFANQTIVLEPQSFSLGVGLRIAI